MAAAGSVGRFLGPALGVLPLPKNFSDLTRPLTGPTLDLVNNGYRVAFSAAALIAVVATLVALCLRVPKDAPEPDAEAAAPAL
jgi:hypothetical protein